MATSGGAIEREGVHAREVVRPALAARVALLWRRVPKPLLALLVIALIEGAAWIVVLPPLQGPDEASHFAYVQKIAVTGSIPWHTSSHEPAKLGQAYSTEVEVAGRCSGLTGLERNPAARAPASAVDERACFAELNRLPRGARSDGGFTSAFKNPPLYYLYEAVPYLMFHNSTFFTRSFAMRLANLPLTLALVVFAWLLAGELLLGLPRGPALRVLATAAVALNPQLMMMTATINPELLLAALWTAGLWLSVVVVRHGLTRARIAWLIAVCAMAAFTQGRGLPLVLPAALAIGVAAWRLRRPGPRLASAIALACVVVLLGGGYVLLHHTLGGKSRSHAPKVSFRICGSSTCPSWASWRRRSTRATASARCSSTAFSARSPSSR